MRLTKLQDALVGVTRLGLDTDATIAEVAADLRARYNLRTPDALQAATALHSGCEAFLTNNDKHFRRATDLQVLILNELEL